MDKNTMKILLASTLVVLGTGVAMAQERGGGMPTFEELDVDGSGEITTEDLSTLRDNRFAEIDANKDGGVSKEEFLAHAASRSEARASRMFDRLDADGDGILSRDVIESRGRGGDGSRMIERFDADNSGGIDAEEFEEAKARIGDRIRDRRRGDDHRRN